MDGHVDVVASRAFKHALELMQKPSQPDLLRDQGLPLAKGQQLTRQ